MVGVVAKCPNAPKLVLLTDVKVDERFYEQVAGNTLSVGCPRCATTHTYALRDCKIYRLNGRVPKGEAARAS